MSDEDRSGPVNGPVMIAATKIIKAPAARVGQIGSNITLPRTVEVRKLAAGAVGAALGVTITAIFGSYQAILVGAAVGGFFGVVAMSWSPVKGETFLQWIGVSAVARARQRKLRYGGDTVAVYIGIARLHRVNAGRVHIAPGAIDVLPDQVDDRGVLRSPANRNVLPVRPHVADRPSFTPLYAQDLPDEMLAAMGPDAKVARRAPGPDQGPSLDAPPVAPVVPATTNTPEVGRDGSVR